MKSLGLEEGFGQQDLSQQCQWPNLTEPDCDRIDYIPAGGAKVGDGCVTNIARQTGFDRHQCQVGDRGGKVQLEPGFDPPKLASLAIPQLDQSGQPMPHHHPPLPVPGNVIALLQGAGLL